MCYRSPGAGRIANHKIGRREEGERLFSAAPTCRCWVYDWLDVHSSVGGSVYDQAGPKSFDLPDRNQLMVERTVSRLRSLIWGLRAVA
jgi:hypothetical protein